MFGHTEILGEIELRGIAASGDPKFNWIRSSTLTKRVPKKSAL
jgi:hypothetical protein